MKTAAFVIAALVALLLGAPAFADVHVGASATGTWASAQSRGPGSTSRGEASTTTNQKPSGHYVTIFGCQTGAEAACHDPGICPGGSTEEETYFVTASGEKTNDTFRCRTNGTTPQARPRLTPGLILNAFRQIPLPASPLNLQPSGGTTIVNFPTIAYTTAPTRLTKTLTLLGHVVTFHIHPTTYTWHWGDGTSTTTHDPGAPYRKTNPRLRGDIAHKYEQKATFHPHLDTTYTATYTVDNNNPRPVPGTVTIPGTPHHLTATTYTPVLVSH